MSTTFDFQDGHGPVPAHRHKNADGTEGGWVANTARVSGNALVYGNAYLAWGFMRYRWTIHREKDNTPILVYGCERHSVAEWKKDITKIVARHVADTKQRGEFKKIITALLGMAATIPSVKRAKGVRDGR